jgi:hypothetical protein
MIKNKIQIPKIEIEMEKKLYSTPKLQIVTAVTTDIIADSTRTYNYKTTTTTSNSEFATKEHSSDGFWSSDQM